MKNSENPAFSRTLRLLGPEALDHLGTCHVAVFGLGGVGGYVTEALARSGIGKLDLVDSDEVEISNLNRQILALHSNLGQSKTETARKRCLDINPQMTVRTFSCFFLPETASQFDFSQYDYVVDAVDTVTAKIGLVMACRKVMAPIICSMGTGNKLDPSLLRIGDLYETSLDPLAKVMRKELRKRGVEHLNVVYSLEKPIEPLDDSSSRQTAETLHRHPPGSSPFVPSAAGLLIASFVVRELTGRT